MILKNTPKKKKKNTPKTSPDHLAKYTLSYVSPEMNRAKTTSKQAGMDFPGGPVVKTPNVGGLGSIPGQGTMYHMPQLRPGTAK